MPKVSDFFTSEQENHIISAIISAENKTSGEIRVHIEEFSLKEEVMQRARTVFNHLQMEKTRNRNGILFYLNISQKKFAILGDIGINEKVEENFWQKISEILSFHFKKEEFCLGLEQGIKKVGEELKKYFPFDRENDENELKNDISVEKIP